ncbi:hypothetical protein CYMTET_35930 [Cymbomonas tetramitiformis]|uniref:Uncharacterized protein n=1 Tax=Cymbomonas tetramitiformis TaxID=36881 RepID=A0AAE0KNI2_9CHLO|nr:hypothetical protein CYMTET_35930 [Cymbomonas tetramitiformis]
MHTSSRTLGVNELLSFDLLQQRCDYYFVNVLQQTHTTEVAAAAKGVLADRRRQLDQKNANDAKKLVCAVCSGTHSSESCWLVRPDLMEEYIKQYPDRERNTRRMVAGKKKKLARDTTETDNTDKTDTACAAISVPSSAKTTDEIWDAEEHDEVPCACPAVQHCADQAMIYAGELLRDTWVHGVAETDGSTSSTSSDPSTTLCTAASTVDSPSSTRVLYYDSMATKTVLNDISYFIPGTFDPDKAVSFSVMAGEVTTSRGSGMASVKLYNFVTQQIDVLCVEAQFVPDSPFNLLSAVCLEDRYNLYGQLMHRELISRDGQSRYKLEREGVLFVLPEAAEAPREAAFPTVAEKLEEYYSEKDSVFDHCLAGRAFYANMPFIDSFISRLMVKILTDFRKDPKHTKFLLVLPYKSSSPWWALTAKFEELHIYSKGSVIFFARADQCYRVEELTESEPRRVWINGTPWPVVLFYLDQFTVGRVDAKLLLHLRLGHICDNYIAAMDMQGLDLGVSFEELRDSDLSRCSEQCMPCQVAKPTRPSQTMDRGRVPKNIRKALQTRQKSLRLVSSLLLSMLDLLLHRQVATLATLYTLMTILVLATSFSGSGSWSTFVPGGTA